MANVIDLMANIDHCKSYYYASQPSRYMNTQKKKFFKKKKQ